MNSTRARTHKHAPLPVAPYAKTVALMPLSTLLMSGLAHLSYTWSCEHSWSNTTSKAKRRSACRWLPLTCRPLGACVGGSKDIRESPTARVTTGCASRFSVSFALDGLMRTATRKLESCLSVISTSMSRSPSLYVSIPPSRFFTSGVDEKSSRGTRGLGGIGRGTAWEKLIGGCVLAARMATTFQGGGGGGGGVAWGGAENVGRGDLKRRKKGAAAKTEQKKC